jgi:hypothetical protein
MHQCMCVYISMRLCTCVYTSSVYMYAYVYVVASMHASICACADRLVVLPLYGPLLHTGHYHEKRECTVGPP